MSYSAPSPAPMTRTALVLSPRIWMLLAAAIALVGLALMLNEVSPRQALLASGLSLVLLVIMIRVLTWRHRRSEAQLRRHLEALIGLDSAPGFTTDLDGMIDYRNNAATERFGEGDGASLAKTMGDLFANPAAVLYRLQTRALVKGAAREDVVTRRGHVRLAVHRIGESRFLWRLEEMLEKSGPGRGAEGLSLPMMVASKSGTILFMNEALRRILGGRPKTLDRVFTELPIRTGEEARIDGADGPLRALVAEVEGMGERREIYLLPASDDEYHSRGGSTDFEDLPVALVSLSPDGLIITANKLARQLLCLHSAQGGQITEHLEGLGRPVGDWLDDVIAGRMPGRPEILRVTHCEEEVFLQVSLRRTLEAGKPGLLAVLNDATELKTLEAQFVQSQKMQAIGQLAGGVAHDFNNLLTAISGHCDLLLLRHDNSDVDYADLVQIHQNANRAASLVGQLLAFSRKQTLKPQLIDLRDTLSDLTHLLNRLVGEKVTLCLSHDADLGPIRADKRQLEQVFMNLVVNARDAMPNGGTIWVETEARSLDKEVSRDRAVVPPGDYVVVRVRDEGVGIAPEKLTKIFEPFYTTKKTGEGTGLGLSTAYGIVKQTGGFIFADSVPNSGTTFTLYFPVHDAPIELPPEVRKVEENPIVRQGEGVVLLVEDEAPVRAFASRALRLRGYTVLEAENAEEALKTLEDPDLSVDVFVTDVIMPGMDGPSWVREALKDRPGVKVVFVSGYAEESFADAQAKIPNSVYLPKPFSLVELTATVQGQIH